jgi:hypothetical protein
VRRGRTAGLVVATGLALAGAAGAADLRRVESVGAAPAGSQARSGGTLRQAALEAALRDAVRRVAAELSGRPEEDPGLERALGERPLDYVARYRLTEDRGERRALLVDDPQAVLEYVVVAEVHVDAARLRARLEQAGLLAPPAALADASRVHLVLEGVRSWGAVQAIRARLARERAVRSVVPEAIEAGGVTLAVETSRRPGELADALLEHPPQGVEVHLVRSDADGLRLRVVELERPEEPGGPAPPAKGRREPASIDTPGRKRY